MGSIRYYPRRCRKNIIRLMYMLSMDAETAFDVIDALGEIPGFLIKGVGMLA